MCFFDKLILNWINNIYTCKNRTSKSKQLNNLSKKKKQKEDFVIIIEIFFCKSKFNLSKLNKSFKCYNRDIPFS